MLVSLIDRWQHLPPEYQGDLSDHLPMALRAFAVNDVKRFEGAPATTTGQMLTRWQDHRGDFSRFADLRASLALAIAQLGALVTLQQALPDLWPGVAAAAFHGLVRTSHAWQMSHDGELANGLAYWASRWQPVPAMPIEDALAFATWTAQLAAHGAATPPEGRLIPERIAQIQDRPTFRHFRETPSHVQGAHIA